MAKKKKEKASKREMNIPFRVKDMIRAMEFALDDYGNICICNLILGCIPASVNSCIYNKRDNVLYFKSFANKEEALKHLNEDEELVYGIERKEKEEENEVQERGQGTR